MAVDKAKIDQAYKLLEECGCNYIFGAVKPTGLTLGVKGDCISCASIIGALMGEIARQSEWDEEDIKDLFDQMAKTVIEYTKLNKENSAVPSDFVS